MKTSVTFFFLFIVQSLFGQILDVDPAFPTVDDVVTVIYNSNEGNGTLIGVSPIYAHAGVITSQSNAPNDWKYVQGNWGTMDANVLMTDMGGGLHSIQIDMDLFYGFPSGTIVEKMAFVFRNGDGSIVGRDYNGADIYYDVYPVNSGLLAKFFSPQANTTINSGSQMDIVAKSNEQADLRLYDNGTLISSVSNADTLVYNLVAGSSGDHELVLEVDNGTTVVYDTIHYVVNPNINTVDPPAGTLGGVNHINSSTIRLQLFAPNKEHIYVLGDFNNWSPSVNYHMNRGVDNATWWVEISGLTPGTTYGYQYLIDGEIVVADPLSTLIADPNNDHSISAQTYPNPYPYPGTMTSGFISLFETDPTAFNWQYDNEIMPEKENLIIYELLVRDFVSKSNYLTLIDALDYLDSLGINAIELMPVGEFENNNSWGYNPSFHMALDKYYGTPEHFKTFVDACHQRGIAVILDIALNHTFGQSPMLAMYWDGVNNKPAVDNPWFNVDCPHEPYCWGYDINHEVQATKDYIDRVNLHWVNEFHIDGFRFDFTKGFGNNTNGYDLTRINNLKRMVDTIWTVDPGSYIILEHWADNSEEMELADHGMLLWGNVTYNYHQAMKGYSSNLSSGIHTQRGWNHPHLVTYIESHDEERGIYECLNYGNTSNPLHNPRDLHIALKRGEAAAVILLTTPGPKMIWQFGELGYDISINHNCRTCPKPILWQYFDNLYRKNVYNLYKSLTFLRTNYPNTFNSTDFSYAMTSSFKKLTLLDPSMDAVVFSHFGLDTANAIAGFPSTGTWYEYFSGDSLEVSNVNMSLELEPAAYRIFTTQPLPKPDVLSILGVNDMPFQYQDITVFPNPATNYIEVKMNEAYNDNFYMITNDLGQIVHTGNIHSNYRIPISNLAKGNYFIFIENASGIYRSKFLKQ